MEVIKEIQSKSGNWDLVKKKIDTLTPRSLEGKVGMKLVELLVKYDQAKLLHDILITSKQKINLDFSDRYGRTVIHRAVENKSADVLETLLMSGVSEKVINKRDKFWYFSPLHYAILNKDIPIVKLLLQYGADPNNKADFADPKLVNVDVENAKYPSRIRPIHLAAIGGNVEIIKLLLATKKKVGINSHAERDGLTSLFMAVIEYVNKNTLNSLKPKLLETIVFLLENGANPKSVNYDGESILYYPNVWENDEMFELFADKIDPNLINYNNDTVLHNRILQPKFSKTKKEIQKHLRILTRMDSFYINYPNVFYYDTLLHLYSSNDVWKDLESVLSKKYLNVYIENKDGYTPYSNIRQRDRQHFLTMVAKGYIYCLQNCPDAVPVKEWERKCKRISGTFADIKKLQQIAGTNVIGDREKLCILVANKMISKEQQSVPKFRDRDVKLSVSSQTGSIKINWWTATAFEIFFGLIYLTKKYKGKGICFMEDYSFIKDPDRRYMSIHDLFEDNLTKFCFAWHNDILKYSPKFESAIKKCSERFFVIPLALNYGRSMEGHFNSLLIDNTTKTIERFEPHGYKSSWYHNYKQMDERLTAVFKKLLPGYSYIDPEQYINRIGFQGYDSVTNKFDITQFVDMAYCVVWSFWYIDLRLGNPDMSRNKAVELALLKIHTHFSSSKKFIMAYSNNILKPRDKILAACGINIDTYVADRTTIKDTQCLINKLKTVISFSN
jgi:ankyrin repeat protein